MNRLTEIQLGSEIRDIGEYKKFNPKIYKRLIEASKKLQGQTVIHINATPSGGGVVELLKSEVPIERALGIKSRWLYILASRRFFVITKKIHNFLQGKGGVFAKEEKKYYLDVNSKLGESLRYFLADIQPDIVVAHDPQLIPIIEYIPTNIFSVLRLHIDLSTCNPGVLEFLKPYIKRYKLAVVSTEEYKRALAWLAPSKIKIIPPAIDPLSEKNMPMDLSAAKRILRKFGVDVSRPILTQVSRFDPWKDPLGVIRAYYTAKIRAPKLQLVLAGLFAAQDDPEAFSVYEKTKDYAKNDPDIFLFSDPEELLKRNISNDAFVNALYTASTLIIQKSTREGFGLTVTEAMWKGKALIAGATSGTMLQIQNGKNGILISSPEEAADAIVRLLENPRMRNRLGREAKKSVRKNFLMPRFVLDNIELYEESR